MNPLEDKSDKQHLVDAVDLLDKLETDLGSVSLDFGGGGGGGGPGAHADDEQPAATFPPRREPTAPTNVRPASASARTGSGGGDSAPATPATAYAAAACLVRILEALPEPVVETRLYEAAIQSSSREAAYEVLHSMKEVVRSLPIFSPVLRRFEGAGNGNLQGCVCVCVCVLISAGSRLCVATLQRANTLLYLIAFLRIILRQQTDAANRAYLLLRLGAYCAARSPLSLSLSVLARKRS